ncbi:MAG: hypothetical protein ACTSX8_03570 [Alphaproteobacteria bacterium]
MTSGAVTIEELQSRARLGGISEVDYITVFTNDSKLHLFSRGEVTSSILPSLCGFATLGMSWDFGAMQGAEWVSTEGREILDNLVDIASLESALIDAPEFACIDCARLAVGG